MGNLLQLLRREDNCKVPDAIFLDFENALPVASDQALYELVQVSINKSHAVLEGLRSYGGAAEIIREAIQNNNSEEAQVAAWEAVCPLVTSLNEYYQYSIELEANVVQLLGTLCAEPPMETLDGHQALAKQFAMILDFVLAFDDLKAEEHEVSNEVANRMSMFYANATPMLKMLSNAVTNFVKKNPALPLEHTTDIFSTMANLCRCMIEDPEINQKFEKPTTVMFVLRVMVGAIILYDHVHPAGAFYRKSNIDMKSSIKLLKDHPSSSVETLLNAMRYSTVHINDDETPNVIKKLLSEQ